jgi:hypothetical protein
VNRLLAIDPGRNDGAALMLWHEDGVIVPGAWVAVIWSSCRVKGRGAWRWRVIGPEGAMQTPREVGSVAALRAGVIGCLIGSSGALPVEVGGGWDRGDGLVVEGSFAGRPTAGVIEGIRDAGAWQHVAEAETGLIAATPTQSVWRQAVPGVLSTDRRGDDHNPKIRSHAMAVLGVAALPGSQTQQQAVADAVGMAVWWLRGVTA